MNQPTAQPGLFIGIDWADQKHDIHAIDREGKGFHQQLEHSAESIDAWVAEMLKLAGGQPIAIMLEQSRGALIYALMFRENVLLYPVNPKQLARYRDSYPGGGKSDPTDAMYLARMLLERITTLKAWQPDDENTRLIANLSQQRRKLVDGQTKLRLQLTALLKSCFPVVLELFGKQHQLPLLLSVLCRWSDPRQLRRADRRLIRRVLSEHSVRNEQQQKEILERIRAAQLLTRDDAQITPSAMAVKLLAHQIQQSLKAIEEFDAAIDEAMKQHPDAHLFTNLRGAGSALAPRLLCAFGSQRDRWEDADSLASFSGIAPVTKQSGKQRHVHRRFACPKYLRQTFHEFADCARRFCPWSKARYRMLRDRGMKHHAALRKIARSWIRILFRVWKTRVPFDCDRYIANLKQRCPDIIPYLAQEN
ncbi:IS110 family transposase [Bythopirellula polymerisocia]|uniref:Transposase n=1 Tax=Bythopirellula polymerisocia TaxID=2528003 RepID=A0A5C6CBY1_9BACT|nr:IS110 family transposase [Bythopirellula polymerisocia]TWU20339.1 Transposase [Bythopirellula polymerisocia]